MDRSAARRILGAGIGPAVRESLDAVAESTTAAGQPRYSPATLDRLRAAIAGRTHAKAIYELCHLLNAADALGIGRDRLERFFFGYGVASAGSFKARIDTLLAKQGGWRRPGIERVADGVDLTYRDDRAAGPVRFFVHFGRMPFLSALLDFLVALASYRAIDVAIREMLAEPSTIQAVQRAANRITSLINRDLADELESAQTSSKFQAMIDLLAPDEGSELALDDTAVLGFWSERSADEDGDYRTFVAVFDLFVAFLRALEAAEARRSIDGAAPIVDREGAEVDLGSVDEMLGRAAGDDADEETRLADLVGAWRSPLGLLDEEPASRVKFLNRREREALERLVDAGPEAIDLPLSVLRAEVFGLVQARLTQALRRGAGREERAALMRPAQGESYEDWRQRWSKLRAHIERMQKAALHVLARDGLPESTDLASVDLAANDAPAFDPKRLAEVLEECRRAFRGFARQGFDDATAQDPDGKAAFRAGLGVLLEVDRCLSAYLALLDRIGREAPPLAARFAEDGMTFARQFAKLYQVT